MGFIHHSLQAPVRRNMTCICYGVVDFFFFRNNMWGVQPSLTFAMPQHG